MQKHFGGIMKHLEAVRGDVQAIENVKRDIALLEYLTETYKQEAVQSDWAKENLASVK